MKQLGCIGLLLAVLFQSGSVARAQNSLQALEQELKEAKQQHDDTTSQTMASFFQQVDAAMASPDAAAALYEQAGGTPPDPTDVVTVHDSETATEKDARLARDQANLTIYGTALELQCGLLHYAALFVTKPDQPGLQDDFTNWLKTAAKTYPQLALPPIDKNAAPPVDTHKKKKDRDRERDREQEAADLLAPPTPPPPPPPYNPTEIKNRAMRDTLISKYLGFKAWGDKSSTDKNQGDWAVADIPKLYRQYVLDPQRTAPTTATLAAWDAYIAMANSDERDTDTWTQSTYPPLQFERACDDYTIAPSTEKLEGLIALIKANQTHPQAGEWFTRVEKMMNDYAVAHGGAPQTPAPSSSASAPTNSNQTVTTEGDMTIITTAHTNAAPTTPPPPAP
jgi:hypothetical protein